MVRRELARIAELPGRWACRAPGRGACCGPRSMCSSGSPRLIELREILCRVLRQDGWTIGLWCGGLTGRCGAVTRYADGPLRRRGGFGLERRWAAKAGTVLSAGADVRGWEIAWGGSSEPGAAVSTECWTGALDGRICRGLDWRVASGAPYPSQDMPSARCAGREPGQPGLARGSPEARPGP